MIVSVVGGEEQWLRGPMQKSVVGKVKGITWKKYSGEQEIRIVLEGLWGRNRGGENG